MGKRSRLSQFGSQQTDEDQNSVNSETSGEDEAVFGSLVKEPESVSGSEAPTEVVADQRQGGPETKNVVTEEPVISVASEEPAVASVIQAPSNKRWKVRPRSGGDWQIIAAETIEDVVRAYNASNNRGRSALAYGHLQVVADE